MPFPYEMDSGAPCPVCTLGECGDENCPTYRPKHPEVREAIEQLVVERCVAAFAEPTARLATYVSVGCGLLAQDWIILEKLKKASATIRPSRAVFVELRAAQTAVSCEGRSFEGSLGLDMRQIGFAATLGPEFSFSAAISFEGPSCWGSRIFDFGNGPGADNIFVEAVAPPAGEDPEAPGDLVFGVLREDVPMVLNVEGCWLPGEAHLYLFTVSSTGVMRVYVDEQLVATGEGHPPRPVERRHLFVGQSSEAPDIFFKGSMRKIKVWDHCVDLASVDAQFESEMGRALEQFAQWYGEELEVWTFGSLASYAEAVAEDPGFAADLLLRVDVHELIDGYDDFVRKVLSRHGLALTLGGPGRSWRRRGAKVEELDVKCEVLEAAEARHQMPWVFYGPSRAGQEHFCAEAKSPLRGCWPARPRRHTALAAGEACAWRQRARRTGTRSRTAAG